MDRCEGGINDFAEKAAPHQNATAGLVPAER